MIEKILFPSKFYESDFSALKSILVLKEVGLKEIVFLYVIEPEAVIVPKTGEILKEELERLKKLAQVQFEEWIEFLQKFNINAKSYVLLGEPAEKILELAEKENVDLVVLNHKKKRNFLKFFITGIGSTVLTLLKIICTPVIIFPYPYEEDENIFSDVLIAIDFSKNSEEVINYLKNLKPLVKRAVLIHVIENEEDIDNIEEVKNKLDEYKNILEKEGINAYHFIYYGKTYEKIIEAAKEHKVKLVAMGITGKHEEEKRRFDFIFIGSVTQKVVDLSDKPVFLVPPKRKINS